MTAHISIDDMQYLPERRLPAGKCTGNVSCERWIPAGAFYVKTTLEKTNE